MKQIIEKPEILSETEALTKNIQIVDGFTSAIEELYFIEHPQQKKAEPGVAEALAAFLAAHTIAPIYVYYPWKELIIKTVPEDIYYRLRTSRNRFIISDEEQEKYRNFKIGIAGLSVGSAILSSVVVNGGANFIKIADFDVLEITNLNRIRAKLTDIGQEKTLIAAKEVWELDPFTNLELWSQGVTKETLEKFLTDPKLDVFVDEMDSLDLKIAARFICREAGIPVLMATDNGDGIILDIERYDLDQTLPIFHGLLGDVTSKDFEHLDYKMWLQLATKIVGPTYLTERMQESLAAIGKIIPSVPQLGTSANIAGAAISFSLRRIASGASLDSGRFIVSLEEKIIPGYSTDEAVALRKQKTQMFIEQFGKK